MSSPQASSPEQILTFKERNLKINKIAASHNISGAVSSTGKAFVWGEGFTLHPTQLEIPGQATDIAVGDRFALVLDHEGKIYACGMNQEG